jgi:hypothetical protein
MFFTGPPSSSSIPVASTNVRPSVRPWSVHPQSSSIFFHRFTFILLFFRACSLTSLFNKLSYSRDLSLNGVF